MEEKFSNADPSFKKSSISGMGLSRPKKSRFKTVFDREEELDDEEAPGGFRRPEEAFEMARNDLRSKEWQTEIDGLEALLRLVRFHYDLVERDLHVIVADVTHECKNLRSQVTRAAIQTAALMVAHLDVAADVRGVKELAQVGRNGILYSASISTPVQDNMQNPPTPKRRSSSRARPTRTSSSGRTRGRRWRSCRST